MHSCITALTHSETWLFIQLQDVGGLFSCTHLIINLLFIYYYFLNENGFKLSCLFATVKHGHFHVNLSEQLILTSPCKVRMGFDELHHFWWWINFALSWVGLWVWLNACVHNLLSCESWWKPKVHLPVAVKCLTLGSCLGLFCPAWMWLTGQKSQDYSELVGEVGSQSLEYLSFCVCWKTYCIMTKKIK